MFRPDRVSGHAPPARQPTYFLLIYALAAAGGAVAYTPFLAVLLPVRIAQLVGTNQVEALSYIVFLGAIAASISNVAFGWASDRTKTRRVWIFVGLVLSSALLVAVGQTDSLVMLAGLIVAWQVALNMMLAPLAAWAGDCFPDDQKGTLGGLLSLAPAFGALAGVFVTMPGLAAPDERLWLVAGLVVLLVSPALVLGKGRARGDLMQHSIGEAANSTPKRLITAAVPRMWMARLLIQISEAALFAFLLFWLRSLYAGLGDDSVAQVFGAVLCIGVPVALLSGRWSDRFNRPILPLAVACGVTTLGLLMMALAGSLAWAIGAYVVFGVAATVFLSLHTAQTLRVLPRPATRGRDLGLFNLTNTVPSLIMPWLALSTIPGFGFDGLFVVLAILSGAATILLIGMTRSN